MESTHQEASGRIEYGVIDVIGHRLGIKTQLEHIQAAAVRKTIKNVINQEVKAAIENRKLNVDDIRESTELIRGMITAHAETTTFKTIVRIDIGVDWEDFKKELEAATVDDLLVQAIANILHGREETTQESSANHLPHEDLVNHCVESIMESRLLENYIRLYEKGGRTPELYMYEPMAMILSKIQELDPVDRPSEITRVIIYSETSGPFRHGEHNLNDLNYAPDFAILDVGETAPLPGSIHYRQMASFIEVKGKDRQGPTPHRLAKGGYKDKSISNQYVDYASLIMTARPFNVFAIGLIIHGEKFTVMYADRSGICFSPEYSFKDSDHFKLFVCIMIRLTFYMNDNDMGKDPTVTIAKGSYYSEDYPEFIVKMRDSPNETYTWSTYGHPLFVSRSLFGRGCSTWRAVGFDKQHCVLKCAWKAKAKTYSESSIYNIIGSHPGIAQWLDGDDVKLNSTLLTTRFLRDRKEDLFDCQLHRVAIEPIGKPLWEFTTGLELLLGFRSALQGHQYMFETKGILHRDVSAGNILLCDDTHVVHSHVRHGFLFDPELALVINPDTPTSMPADVDPPQDRNSVSPLAKDTSGLKTTRPLITGTPQFMAIEVLRAVTRGPTQLPRKLHHDLESFIWVFHYTLYMHVFQLFKLKGIFRDDLTDEFKMIFGLLDIKDMIGNRTSEDHTYLGVLADALVSLGYLSLFQFNKELIALRIRQVPRQGLGGFSSLASLKDAKKKGDVKATRNGQAAAINSTHQTLLVEFPPDTTDLLTYDKLQSALGLAIDIAKEEELEEPVFGLDIRIKLLLRYKLRVGQLR